MNVDKLPKEQLTVKNYKGWQIYRLENRYYGKSNIHRHTGLYSSIELVIREIDRRLESIEEYKKK
jgi:hypothetical protein